MIKRSATLAAGLCVVLAMAGAHADTTSSAASWRYPGPQAGAHCGASLAVLKTTVAGGFDALAVGLPDYNGPQGLGAGRVLVFRGGPDGLSANPSITIDGDKVGGHLGWDLASAGDVDGDGKSDLLAGSPFYTTTGGGVTKTNAGKAFLFLGSHLVDGSITSAQADWAVAGSAASEQLGTTVEFVKDATGDGRAELAVGSNNVTTLGSPLATSKIQVFTQSPGNTTPQLLWTTSVASSYDVGPFMCGSGDFDGDGRGDLAVGLPFFNTPGGRVGGVSIYRGSTTGFGTAPAWTLSAQESDSFFGIGLAYVSQLTPDGRDALIVSAATAHDPGAPAQIVGALYVYHGRAPGETEAPPAIRIFGTASVQLGTDIASVPDLNGDGISELAVGIPVAQFDLPFEGGVRIFASAPGGVFSTLPLWTAHGDTANARLGDVVVSGHFDGHPYPDLAVGAPWSANDQNMVSAGNVYSFCNPTAPPFLQGATIRQYRLDGHTPVADNHETNQDGFVVSATAVDPNGEAVRIDVQVKSAASPWTDAPPFYASSFTGSGLPSSALVRPLDTGSYKWRVRAVNQGGSTSPWTHFGGEEDVDLVILPNTAPEAPAPRVINEATGAPLESEATLYDGDAVRVEARVDDPDANAAVLELELRETGSAFSGLPTHRSDPGPSGSTLGIPLSLPIHLPGYVVRVRTTDERGAHSAWVAPASHVEGRFDFKVVSMGSLNVVKQGCASSAPAAAPAVLVLAGFAVLLRRRA